MGSARRGIGAVAVVGALLSACGSPSAAPSGASAPGSSWLVTTSAGTLAAVASPGPSWTRMQTSQLAALLGPNETSEPAGAAGAPALAVRDSQGRVTIVMSGWTADTGPATAPTLCHEAGSWLAKAEDTYGLVPTSGEDLESACGDVREQRATNDPAVPLASECAPGVSNRPSTCASLSAQRSDAGGLRVSALVFVQG
jgi:hypothetical protein